MGTHKLYKKNPDFSSLLPFCQCQTMISQLNEWFGYSSWFIAGHYTNLSLSQWGDSSGAMDCLAEVKLTCYVIKIFLFDFAA